MTIMDKVELGEDNAESWQVAGDRTLDGNVA